MQLQIFSSFIKIQQRGNATQHSTTTACTVNIIFIVFILFYFISFFFYVFLLLFFAIVCAAAADTPALRAEVLHCDTVTIVAKSFSFQFAFAVQLVVVSFCFHYFIFVTYFLGQHLLKQRQQFAHYCRPGQRGFPDKSIFYSYLFSV